MLSSRNIVVHFVLLSCICPHYGLGWPRDIAPADSILHVVDDIFSSLRVKLKNNNKKELSMIHKYFVGFSQNKNDNWKGIVNLTRFDIKIDNGSADYTTVINEVLNRENKPRRGIDKRNYDGVNKKSRNFLRKLNEAYFRNNSYRSVNNNLLHNKSCNNHSSSDKNTKDEELSLQKNGTDELDVWVPSDSRRVFKGERTKIYYFPFIASIHIFKQFTCAGSIISNDLVITAASCLQLAHNNRFYRENPSFLAVRVGSSSYSGAGEFIPALEVYFHESYDPQSLKNNLAIIRLLKHIRFRDHSRVKRIDIDTNAHALPVNTLGVAIVGWGAKTVANKVETPVLSQLAMAVLEHYPLQECQDIYSKTFVTERNFCAGFVSRGGGACNRDVGAPGVTGGVLAGVVSFGSATCGSADSPTVFTKIGFYTKWIERVMAMKAPRGGARATTAFPRTPHTIMANQFPLRDLNFLIEPVGAYEPPSLSQLDVRTGHEKESKESAKETESGSYEQINTNKEQREDEDIELAEHIKNTYTQEQVETGLIINRDNGGYVSGTTFQPVQYISSVRAMDDFTLQEKISELSQADRVKTKTDVAEQLRDSDKYVARAGLRTNEKNTEPTFETRLDKTQFVQFEAKESDVMDMLNEVETELSDKYTEADNLPQIDEIKITTNKVVAEQQPINVNYIDLTRVKKYTESESTFHREKLVLHDTRENSFVRDERTLSEVGKRFAMNYSVAEKSSEPVHEQISANRFIALQLPQIPMPEKQSPQGKIVENKPLKLEADPPTIGGGDFMTEQPEVTFTDSELDQQIDELIDYMNVINIISSEEDYISKGSNIINTKVTPEELDKLEPDEDKLVPTS